MCRVTMGHLRVTVSHPRVTIGHLRVTVGHPRVTIGHYMITIGYRSFYFFMQISINCAADRWCVSYFRFESFSELLQTENVNI